jgi:Fur family ferric uptake transcriptional regulator
MSYTQEAIKILKDKGYKNTKPRQIILKVLDQADLPLSPYEISEKIKDSGETGDVVGVYRCLEILEENDLVHKVLSSGKYLKCKLKLDTSHNHEHSCHHNLVCKKCGKLIEIDCIDMGLFKRIIASEHNFEIHNHALEFYGICSDCKI